MLCYYFYIVLSVIYFRLVCRLCLSCYYFYIVLSLHLYCCYVVYLDHHFTVIYLQTCVPCVCLVITSTLFYLYACTVVMLCIQIDHHFTVISLQTCVVCVCLVILLHCFIFMLVLLLCCVYRSSLYCNISSDLCSLCLSCYYFYIVLSLCLYCCYVCVCIIVLYLCLYCCYVVIITLL